MSRVPVGSVTAVRQRAEGIAAPTAEATPRVTHPVLLVNPKSGGGKAAKFRLADRCRELGIEPVVLAPGDDLLQLAEGAVTRGCDLLGMAGGDGSQAVVAAVAARCRIPLVVVPAGTRNHFARDLGVGTGVVRSLSAFVDGVDVSVDLGEVNGRLFVNNASMGAYAEMVRSPHYREAKVRTAVDMLPDLVGPSAARPELRYLLPSGEQATTAHVLLVSNNPYQLPGRGHGAGRPRLDGGVLGVVSVQVPGSMETDLLAALDASGPEKRFPGWHEWTTSKLDIESGQPVALGVDGEALTLDAPLRFVIRPRALVVRVPRRAPRLPKPLPAGAPPSPFTALLRLAAGREA